jgi:hypothetical protein
MKNRNKKCLSRKLGKRNVHLLLDIDIDSLTSYFRKGLMALGRNFKKVCFLIEEGV